MVDLTAPTVPIFSRSSLNEAIVLWRMRKVHSWFRPVIEAVIEGSRSEKKPRRFPPFLTLPRDFRTMKG